MAQSREEAFLDRELARITRRFADLNARLIGYEIALTAVIGALDKSGTLPIAAAKSALDAAVAGIPATSQTSEAIAVLRQLSARLEPPAPPEETEPLSSAHH